MEREKEVTSKWSKAEETDISYEPDDSAKEIVPNPEMIVKGRRVYCEFDKPSKVFENYN